MPLFCSPPNWFKTSRVFRFFRRKETEGAAAAAAAQDDHKDGLAAEKACVVGNGRCASKSSSGVVEKTSLEREFSAVENVNSPRGGVNSEETFANDNLLGSCSPSDTNLERERMNAEGHSGKQTADPKPAETAVQRGEQKQRSIEEMEFLEQHVNAIFPQQPTTSNAPQLSPLVRVDGDQAGSDDLQADKFFHPAMILPAKQNANKQYLAPNAATNDPLTLQPQQLPQQLIHKQLLINQQRRTSLQQPIFEHENNEGLKGPHHQPYSDFLSDEDLKGSSRARTPPRGWESDRIARSI